VPCHAMPCRSKNNANWTSSVNRCKSRNITTIKTFLSWRNCYITPSKFNSSKENISRRQWVCFSLPELLTKQTFRNFLGHRRHKTLSGARVASC
jgi:hypothetical protein